MANYSLAAAFSTVRHWGVDHTRVVEPEVMDDPQLDRRRHEAALAGLARMNVLSASARILWRPLEQFSRQQPGRPVRLLDVAAGSGDVPLALWRRAKRRGIDLEVTCVDASPQALDTARRHATAAGASFRFRHLDVRDDNLPGDFDVVTTSLFLHHLQDSEALLLLQNMKRVARSLVLVQDLVRGTGGFWLAFLATQLFSRSDVVHIDALLSVRAAFTLDEARRLASQAGLHDATVERRWPCRYLLSWERPRSRRADPHLGS